MSDYSDLPPEVRAALEARDKSIQQIDQTTQAEKQNLAEIHEALTNAVDQDSLVDQDSTLLFGSGRAEITLSNPYRGKHLTLRVRAWAPASWPHKLGPKLYWVDVKDSQNKSGQAKWGWAPVGTINCYYGKKPSDKVTYRYQPLVKGVQVEAVHYAAKLICLWQNGEIDLEQLKYKVSYVTRCAKCGKKLSDPVSIESGLGNDCARQLGVKHGVHASRALAWLTKVN